MSHVVAFLQKLVQLTFCLDSPVLQHDDVVGAAQRGSAMRDH